MYQSPNYSYYTPQPQMMRTQPQILKGRLVSSPEEARAASIDFDGSVFYFPDIANKKIYTKQINIDGTASMNVYELKEIPLFPQNPVEIQNSSYITREEFEQAIAQLRADLKPEVPKIQF